ncbi:hypothetical protein [Clostridium cochlearium]|uniref:Uncharacterized protein n=1 Tax=Clostridium cochlearium TaxID=1494 RepID=A0A2X2W3J3_CLOCO|nr:hypothetical protein [Clostridium cochlearium]MBE6066070.1 hypothetical protein [Clostridium cochlearium]MBU5269787.1 hypothetical protein [Clostridium cochlearium]SQB35926.1 Uncharacterised protein [Clostridium cochlearium]
MSDYRLDINESINLSDYSLINDYLEIPRKNDKVSIKLNYRVKDEVNIICKILNNKGFNIIDKDGNGYIYASKRN